MRKTLIGIFLLLTSCALLNPPDQIDEIVRSHRNCLDCAIAIAEYRHSEGLPTKIVLAWSPGKAIGDEGWHALWEDEKGELFDTIRYKHFDDWIPAVPKLAFLWQPDMKIANRKVFEAKSYFAVKLGFAKYEVLYGNEYIERR